MTNNKTIVIPGKPIAKARPRFARRGKFVKTYSSQETEEGRIYLEIRQQWKQKPIPEDVGLVVKMSFFFPMPATSKKKQEDMLAGAIKHLKKPDLDNAAKFYLDCMNGLVFMDDKQVYELELSKGYAKEPQTIITVEW